MTKKEYLALTEEQKKGIKEYWLELYRIARTLEDFARAEKELLKIRKWNGGKL